MRWLRWREIGLAAGLWLIVLATQVLADPRRDGQARQTTGRDSLGMKAGGQESLALGGLKAGQTYTLLVTLESGRLGPDDLLTVELSGAGKDRFVKELHAGDPTSTSPIGPDRTAKPIWRSRERRVPAIRPYPSESSGDNWRSPSPIARRSRPSPTIHGGRPTSCSSGATSTARPMTSTTSKTSTKANPGSTGSDSMSPTKSRSWFTSSSICSTATSRPI